MRIGAHAEKQAWCGHPVGARPGLITKGREARPAEPGWSLRAKSWQGCWQDPLWGLKTNRLDPGCGGPDGGLVFIRFFLSTLLGTLALFLPGSGPG